MRIERTKLIARIDDLLEAERVTYGEKVAEKMHDHNESTAKWEYETQPALLAELRRAVETVRKGRPLTRNNSKIFSKRYSGNYLNDDLFSVPSDAPKIADYKPNDRLTALRAFLVSSPDEFISTTALKDLGFQPKTLI